MEEKAQIALEEIRHWLSASNLKQASGVLAGLHPADGADVLLALEEDSIRELLAQISHETTAEIIEHLDPPQALEVTKDFEHHRLSLVLDHMETDKAVDLLNELPPETVADLLTHMNSAAEVAPLLLHPSESAAGVMSLEFTTLDEDMTVNASIAFLRRFAPPSDQIYYLFIQDREHHLKGVVSLRSLIIAQPNERLRDIMDTNVISVQAGTDQEECARIMQHYDLQALPVVDDEKRLIGVITLEEALDVAEEEATEDMYHMAGLSGEEYLFSSLMFSVRKRLPWLFLNVFTMAIAGAVVSLFEETLATFAVLAVFMPIVAGLGGNTGIQTITIMVRGLALGEISPRQAWQPLGKEISLGLIHGLILGCLVGLMAYLWRGEIWLGVVVTLAMTGNMVVAGTVGVLIPLGLRAIKVDPALASGIFLTTFTDVCGLFLLLGLGTLVLLHFI